jgi:hypothetical protein
MTQTTLACTCDSSYRMHTDPYCWKNRECDAVTEESDECEVREHCDCQFLEDDDYHGLPSEGCWSELWQAITSDDDDGDNNGNPSIQFEELINASQPSIKHRNIFWNMDVGRCGYESGFQRPLGSRLAMPIVITVLVGILVALVALFVRRRRISSGRDSSKPLLQDISLTPLPPIS